MKKRDVHISLERVGGVGCWGSGSRERGAAIRGHGPGIGNRLSAFELNVGDFWTFVTRKS